MDSELALRMELALRALPGNVNSKAQKFGVHRTTLHRWASGVSEPTYEDVKKLAEMLGIPTSAIYGPTPVLRTLLPRRSR